MNGTAIDGGQAGGNAYQTGGAAPPPRPRRRPSALGYWLAGAIMLVASITQQNYWALCRRIMPFVVVEILVLVLIVVFPELSLALPRWLGML